MSQIRRAHSNEIIDKRLRQFETLGETEPMELVGLYDELARVERKWLEKADRHRAGDVGTRPLANAAEHNDRFERLIRLIDATLHRVTADSPERQLLAQVRQKLSERQPIKT